MRRAIALITTRYGVAGLIALIVLVVVVGAKIFGASSGQPADTGPLVAVPTTSASASQRIPDDGDGSASPTPPVVKPGQPGPVQVATDCATAWLNHPATITPDQWWQAVTRYTTASLAAKLKGADPQGVPASRIVSPAQLTQHGASWAYVAIQTESGTLTLRMLSGAKGWQVDGIDWTRS